MTIYHDSKIARALARLKGDAPGGSGMTILQDSKIARALARLKGDAPGGAA